MGLAVAASKYSFSMMFGYDKKDLGPTFTTYSIALSVAVQGGKLAYDALLAQDDAALLFHLLLIPMLNHVVLRVPAYRGACL